MRIAVFDDNEKELKNMVALINSWADKKGIRLVIDSYVSSSILESNISSGVFYDLYFLDIMTSESSGTGFHLAEHIHTLDIRALIIFVTNSREYMESAFEITAYRYILKPYALDKVFSALDSAYQRLSFSKASAATFSVNDSHIVIPYNDIIYIESYSHQHKMEVHLSSGSVIKVDISRSKFTDYIQQNFSSDFSVCHKSFAINMNYVTRYKGNEVTLCNDIVLSIGKSYKKDFFTTLTDFYKGQN